jgi:hypothetical protein
VKHFTTYSQGQKLIKAGYEFPKHAHMMYDRATTAKFAVADLQDLIEMAGEYFCALYHYKKGSWAVDDQRLTLQFEASNPIDCLVALLLDNPKKK